MEQPRTAQITDPSSCKHEYREWTIYKGVTCSACTTKSTGRGVCAMMRGTRLGHSVLARLFCSYSTSSGNSRRSVLVSSPDPLSNLVAIKWPEPRNNQVSADHIILWYMMGSLHVVIICMLRPFCTGEETGCSVRGGRIIQPHILGTAQQ